MTEEKNTWVRDRKNLLDRDEIGRLERNRIREKSEDEIKRTIRVLMERVGQKEREGRRRRLEESRYNSKYEKMMVQTSSRLFKKGWKNER